MRLDGSKVEPDDANPPWLPPFEHAVIRLATYSADPKSPLHLVFGTVELLAPGRPPATTAKVERQNAGRRGAVFFHRISMGAQEAVEWYASLTVGSMATPRSSESVREEADHSGIPVLSGPFQSEPLWPELALPVDPTSSMGATEAGPQAPFVGAGAAPARLSRLMAPPDPQVIAILSEARVSDFLRPRLHVDLTSYPEYQGGLALVVPDPVVRRVDMFVRPRPEGETYFEDLVLRMHPRRGIRLDGVAATITETRAGALVRHEHLVVPRDGLVALGRRGETGMAGYVLTHATYGPLRRWGPHPFIRTIGMRMMVANRRVSVEAATGEAPRAATETYDRTEYVPADPIIIAERATVPDGLARIREAEQARRIRATAIVYGQRWLDDPAMARDYVRKIVTRAKRRLWIVDPYLGWRQINQFVHAVTRTDVKVSLLTSKAMLVGIEPSTTEGEPDVEKAVPFLAALADLKRRGLEDVQTLFSKEAKPLLHDRFVVVDDEVWISGTSLHALGHRLSLIVRVPAPAPVISRLDALMKEAVGIEEVLAKSSESLQGSEGSKR